MKLHFAYLAAALMLPTMVAIAADKDGNKEKQEPRPAQESRSGNATGKESTKPSSETPATPGRPAQAKEDSKQQPCPAQESRSSAPTRRDSTKSPEPAK